MKIVKYGSNEYEQICTLGMGAGISYNVFNQAVNLALEAMRQMKEPSIEELANVRGIFERALSADAAFQKACEDVAVVGDDGNFQLLQMIVGLLRRRDHEIKAILDKNYPTNNTLH